MRFGLFYEHQLPRPWAEDAGEKLLNDALEQIELADRLGFDSVWEVEHHFLEEYSHSSAPEVFLAAASQRTKRIRLGHGIVQIPPAFNHPARVAERIATLDLISGGRVEFGTGESSSQAELGAFGVDRNLKHAQWEEALDAITRMMVEEPFAGFQGRFLSMPPRNVVPKPKQKPHPPLWVACSRRDTILQAARKGIGALSFSFIEPEEAREWAADYYRLIASDECIPAGFAVNPNLAVVVPFMCHENEQTAIERGIDGAHFFGYSLAHYYVFGRHEPGQTNVWEEFREKRGDYGFAREIVRAEDAPLGLKLLQHGIGSLRGAIGTPDQVADLMRRYERAGVDAVLFVPQAGRNRHEHICESLELFARRVRPIFAGEAEAREAEKKQRLAAACERALARRSPPRKMPPGYVITAQGEPRIPATTIFARLLHGRGDRQLERILGSRTIQRLVFRSLARAIHPAQADGFSGEIQYDLQGDRRVNQWFLRITNGKAVAESGVAAHPGLKLRMSVATFGRIASGELDPMHAVLEHKLELEGDVKALARFTALFRT
jgi:alkanesulfonate monooxygenase SsuD/methylene tetrahydromethanopterin reductase-like flavin-dependent oxidoreductase (luciferase family)/putative sterol carrier protein